MLLHGSLAPLGMTPSLWQEGEFMAGAIAYISRDTDGVAWGKLLAEALGPIDFRTIANGLGNTDDIEIALAWKPTPGLLRTFRNLKMIVSLGMGVDHLLADDQLPE